jgi:cell division protein FtsW
MIKSQISCRTALIVTVAFLTCLGLLAIYSSSSIPANQTTGDAFIFFRKQAFCAAFGFFAIFITGHLPFKLIERLTLPLAILAVILLCLIQVPGFSAKAGGATRWLTILGLTFQPGEIAKLALVLFLAKNLSRPSSCIESFKSGILANLILCVIFGALLMVQPDLGTTVLLFCVTFLMLFVAGLPRKFIYILSMASVLALVGAIFAAPYRMARLFSFINPWQEIKTGGFQIIQSYLGFQNGGLLGAGLGESRQKLFFLPEAHTDFILSVVGEELGLLGVILVCLLFAYLVFTGYKIASNQVEPYKKFLAFGLTCLIAIQSSMNIGVTMGLLPTKGIPLPFVSHGSSSLLIFLMAAAILARIAQDSPEVADKDNKT